MTKSPSSQLPVQLEDLPTFTPEQWVALTTTLEFENHNNRTSSFVSSSQIIFLLKKFWDNLLPQLIPNSELPLFRAQTKSTSILNWFRHWSGSRNQYVFLYFFIQCYKFDTLSCPTSSHQLSYSQLWLSCLEGNYVRSPSITLIESIINSFRIIKTKSIMEVQVLFPELDNNTIANLLRKLLAHISHQLEVRSSIFPYLIIIFKHLTKFIISSGAQIIQPFEHLKSSDIFDGLDLFSNTLDQCSKLYSITAISSFSTKLNPESWYKFNPLFNKSLHELISNNHDDPLASTENLFEQWKRVLIDYTSSEIDQYIEELILNFYPEKEIQNGLTEKIYFLDYMLLRWLSYFPDRISIILNPLIKMIVDNQIKYFHNKAPFQAFSNLFTVHQYSELSYNVLTYLTMNNNSNRLNGWLAHCLALSAESTQTRYYEFIARHMIIAPETNPDDDGTTLNRWIDFTKGLLCEKKLFITNSFFRFLFKLEKNDPYLKRRLDICPLLQQQLNHYVTTYPTIHLKKLFHLLILDNLDIPFETFKPLLAFLLKHFIEQASYLKNAEAIGIYQIIFQTLISLMNCQNNFNLVPDSLNYIFSHDNLCLPLLFGNSKDDKKSNPTPKEPYSLFPTYATNSSKSFLNLLEFINRIGNKKIRNKILSIWLRAWTNPSVTIPFDTIIHLVYLYTLEFNQLHPWIRSILLYSIRNSSSDQEQERRIALLIQTALLSFNNSDSTQFSNIVSFLLSNDLMNDYQLILQLVNNFQAVSEFFLSLSSIIDFDVPTNKNKPVFKGLVTLFKSRLQFAIMQIRDLQTISPSVYKGIMTNSEFLNSLFLMLSLSQINRVLFDQFEYISGIILEGTQIQTTLELPNITKIISSLNILPILQTSKNNWDKEQLTTIVQIVENLAKPYTLIDLDLYDIPSVISQLFHPSSPFQTNFTLRRECRIISNAQNQDPSTTYLPYA